MKNNQFVIKSILYQLLDLVFPPICLNCQKVLPSNTNELSLCQDCYSTITLMPADFPKSNILDRLSPSYLDYILIACQFDDAIQSVIHHIKYQRKPNLGIKCGINTALVLGRHISEIQDKYYLPVPLHIIRQKERGFNQSNFISMGIMKIYEGILMKDVLIREKNTISQTQLNREERQENINQAFRIRNTIDVSGKTIILVDDLITTGATMNECAKVLKTNGAKNVIGVAVASPVSFNN
jgi:competence protein ComFC